MHQSGYTLYGAYGSVRDFYLENSYGKLDLQVTVTGIYTASKNWKYYGENDENMQDKYSTELAKEAAVFAFSDQSINPADYDNDGDGYIDAFHVFYAGYGEEAGGSTDCIWAHKYGFYPRLTFGNKYLATYSCSPELRSNRNSNITHIGVICHELGHIFGAPDFYDTDDGEFVGTGEWDLMAGGSWNGDGARPAHINMYQKIEYGWVEPVELNAPQNIIGMQNSANFPEAYIIRTSTLNEYYVLENRQKQGFDTSVPGHGLLIYHVSITQNDINRNIVNNGHPQKVYPVCSVNTNVIPSGPNSYGSINSAQCPFPGTSNKRTFGKTSIPAMLTWSGEEVLKPITEITEANQLISFQFMETLLNLTASVSVKQVTIQWKTPDVLEEIAGYNIYCDDQFLNFTTGNAYRNTVRENGAYIYGVSIKYTDGSESAQEKIEVIVTSTAMNTPVKSPTLVFPNPVEKGGLLTVDLDDSYEKAKLLFYDLSGRLIQTLALLPDNQYAINLPPGIYLLKIINKQKTEILKLTIK
jgi:M6 family metalloprotease-like protein